MYEHAEVADLWEVPRRTARVMSVPKWRNWQTRTVQGRVGQPMEVQVLSSALIYFFIPLVEVSPSGPWHRFAKPASI